MQVGSAYYSADFSYKNFINVSTTGRVDKLSTLPSGSNQFFYPSVSASTVISDYVRIPEPISFFKVRASYANVGSGLTRSSIGANPSGSYFIGYGQQFFSSYDGPGFDNAGVYNTSLLYNNQPAAYYTNQLNNKNIKPDYNSSVEVGLDAKFLQNRIGLDVTYYQSDLGPQIFSLTGTC
jgi:hypothetical protein